MPTVGGVLHSFHARGRIGGHRRRLGKRLTLAVPLHDHSTPTEGGLLALYPLLAGRLGGQTLFGGTDPGNPLTLSGNPVDTEPVTRVNGKLALNIAPTIQRMIVNDVIGVLTSNWTTQAINTILTLANPITTIWMQTVAGSVNLAFNNLTNLFGQHFAPGVLDTAFAGSITSFIAADYAPFHSFGVQAIGTLIGVRVNPSMNGVPITAAYGFYSPDWSTPTMTAQKVIKVEDQLTNPVPATRYLMELGAALTPNIRVESAPPTNPGLDKGRSRVLATYNENGVLTVRREEWKTFSTLAAADRVRVAV